MEYVYWCLTDGGRDGLVGILFPDTGSCLNIKTVFPRYGVPRVKDKTVGETVLSLTWESL